MGKNYYLSKGNLNEKFYNIKLTEIFKDMKSLEEIDMYTCTFNDMEELRKELLRQGLIRSTDDICIGTYKTKNNIKQLIPIYNRTLIFKSDLEKLGFTGSTYNELAIEIKDYINSYFNDVEFMSYIINNYSEKYTSSKSERKAPIYESGDISILSRIINSDKKTSRDEMEYAISLKNFINNELFKCEIVYESISFEGNYTENIKIFKPTSKQINIKGLHDLLCHIINYNEKRELKNKRSKVNLKSKSIATYEITEEKEEFLENRDFEIQLNSRINALGINRLEDDTLYTDDYANSIVLDQQRLVKKIDG